VDAKDQVVWDRLTPLQRLYFKPGMTVCAPVAPVNVSRQVRRQIRADQAYVARKPRIPRAPVAPAQQRHPRYRYLPVNVGISNAIESAGPSQAVIMRRMEQSASWETRPAARKGSY